MQIIDAGVWQAATKIGTPLALAAFVVAAGLFIARCRLTRHRKEIEAAPPEQRVQMSETLEHAFLLPLEKLSADKYEIAKRILLHREQRYRTGGRVMVYLASLLAAVALVPMFVSTVRRDSERPNNAAPGALPFPDSASDATAQSRETTMHEDAPTVSTAATSLEVLAMRQVRTEAQGCPYDDQSVDATVCTLHLNGPQFVCAPELPQLYKAAAHNYYWTALSRSGFGTFATTAGRELRTITLVLQPYTGCLERVERVDLTAKTKASATRDREARVPATGLEAGDAASENSSAEAVRRFGVKDVGALEEATKQLDEVVGGAL